MFNGSKQPDIKADAVTFGGEFYDLAKSGVGEDFLCEVGYSLQPGKAAIVAEAWEQEEVLPVDKHMEDLNGIVLRRTRKEVLNPLIKRDIVVFIVELDELNAEHDRSTGRSRATLQRKIDATKDRLRALAIGVQGRIESSRQETEAKMDALQEQADRARGDRKFQIERRIVELQVDQGRRSDLLKQAQELIKQALIE